MRIHSLFLSCTVDADSLSSPYLQAMQSIRYVQALQTNEQLSDPWGKSYSAVGLPDPNTNRIPWIAQASKEKTEQR